MFRNIENSVLRTQTELGFGSSLFLCFHKVGFALFLLPFLFVACNDENEGNSGSLADFDRKAMLETIADQQIIPNYQELKTEVVDLKNATNAFAQDITEANLMTLQEAFVTSYFTWQNVAMFEFGPAMQVALRASMNTYPTTVEQIESNIVAGEYDLEMAANIPAIGLPALDYLLYNAPSNEVVLSFQNEPNKVQYLQDLVNQIESKISFVENEWTANNYRNDFVEASGTDVGSALGQLVNEMVKHTERNLRDGKIGIPAGVRTLGVPLPEKTECYYKNDISIQLAVENLEALKQLFNLGLGDYLDVLNAKHGTEDLSTVINSRFVNAMALLEATSEPLSDTAKDNNDQVMAAYTALQELVVLLKADMSSAMGILITFQDNDGD